MRSISRTVVGILVLAACVAMAAGCTAARDASGEVDATLAPANISVESGDGYNVVQWTAVPGAVSYNLYWSSREPVTREASTRLEQVVSPYRHSGLQNGVHHYYVVTAVHPGGESVESSQVSATPRATVLLAPATVQVVPGAGSITIVWSSVTGATGYRVYWSNASGVLPGGAGVSSISAGSATSQTHGGTTPGLTYHYVVVAVGPAGEGSPSIEVSASPVPDLPAAPINLSAIGGDGVVELSWSPVPGAVSYNVHASTESPLAPGPGTRIASLVTSSFRHEGLTNGLQYRYAVTAVGAGGEGPPSAIVLARPATPPPDAAPSIVAATPGIGSVRISWSPVAGAVSYTIHWARMPGVIPGAAGVDAIPGLLAVTYDHTGLAAGEAHHYVVVAVNSGGDGPPSPEVSAVPRAPAPPTPSILRAVAGDGSVALTWSASEGAVSYNLYWAEATGVVPGGAGVMQVSGVVATSYQHTGLVNGTTLHYVVTAVAADGESLPSVEATVTPAAPPPPPPAWCDGHRQAGGGDPVRDAPVVGRHRGHRVQPLSRDRARGCRVPR